DAPAHRQHQRPADQGQRAQVSLAARPPPRRPSGAQRPRPLAGIPMDATPTYASDVAFTPTVKAIQTRKGSRRGYAGMEQRGSWETRITPDLAAFIAAQTSVFLATANADSQPYIQHRGGPAGFLHVLDERTIGFVDFAGNRQYITQGNLADN